MRLLRRRASVKPRNRCGFWVEDEELIYEPIIGVGTLMSDWGPLQEERTLPWQKKPEPTPKPSFGFARALDEV